MIKIPPQPDPGTKNSVGYKRSRFNFSYHPSQHKPLHPLRHPSPSFRCCWNSYNPSSFLTLNFLTATSVYRMCFFAGTVIFLLSLISITVIATYKPPQADHHDMVFPFYLSIQQLLQFCLSNFTSYNYD